MIHQNNIYSISGTYSFWNFNNIAYVKVDLTFVFVSSSSWGGRSSSWRTGGSGWWWSHGARFLLRSLLHMPLETTAVKAAYTTDSLCYECRTTSTEGWSSLNEAAFSWRESPCCSKQCDQISSHCVGIFFKVTSLVIEYNYSHTLLRGW